VQPSPINAQNSIPYRSGALDSPFDNLFDAIERAYELAIESISANITINLLPGNHYLKRIARSYEYKSLK
jgi:hypothetical protein